MDNLNINLRTPKVSVCVVTYNHEKYIGQCLQSLVDQVTDFDYEIIVGEDCSTDGTRAIVERFAREYPDKVRPILHAKNLGGTKNYLEIHTKVYGEYIAHMDGDDYALPGKLQAQADHLDRHPECAVVWHRMKVLDENSGRIVDDLIDMKRLPKDGFTQQDLLGIGSVACHSSKMYRAHAEKIDYPLGEVLDYYTHVEHLKFGRGQYLHNFLGVYRANIGAMQSGDKIRLLLLTHLDWFMQNYPDYKTDTSAHILRLFLGDLIRRRRTLSFSFKIFLRSSKVAGFIKYLSIKHYFQMFRSPL